MNAVALLWVPLPTGYCAQSWIKSTKEVVFPHQRYEKMLLIIYGI